MAIGLANKLSNHDNAAHLQEWVTVLTSKPANRAFTTKISHPWMMIEAPDTLAKA